MSTTHEFIAIYDDWDLTFRLVPNHAIATAVCEADSARDLARAARKQGITYDQIRNDIPYPKDVAFQKAITGPYQLTAAELLQHLHGVLTELQRQQREREDQYSRGGDAVEALTSRCRAEGLEWAIAEIKQLQESEQ